MKVDQGSTGKVCLKQESMDGKTPIRFGLWVPGLSYSSVRLENRTGENSGRTGQSGPDWLFEDESISRVSPGPI